ncbi:hypothetical protein [Clostridium tarantellae]|uniref:Uncharacterized protein n=1 Tax=Clostridium tarantellae TaxID=39493 RepID=A0A6I1MIU8_9CLOT|nr:hypothetical protein [Clostridium tarantellae]MPQ42844.1 hypothetical protein [Clostridium tarantellae]
MNKKLTKKELVKLVNQIRYPKQGETSELLDEKLIIIEQNVLDPEICDLIFLTDLSDEEVIEKALQYKAIIL